MMIENNNGRNQGGMNMENERNKAARDVELSLERDKRVRAVNAVASEQLTVIFTLAESSFSDAGRRYEFAKWYCLNPDASPVEIMKKQKTLRDRHEA
jgi:hypothetical protein